MIDPAREAIYRRMLGRGLAAPLLFPGVDVGADIAFAAGPNGTTLAQVEGVDNLLQALRLALTTAYGGLLFDTGYGFDGLNAIATETDARMMQERIRIAVAQTVARDARVRRVTDVQVARAPGTRTLDVTVTFDTTASSSLSVTIEGVPTNG